MAKKDPNVIIIQGCPLWMLTMGDCMSLLLTFFVMLMAFSTPDKGQLSDAMQGMKGALGIMDSTSTPTQSQSLSKNSNSNKDTNIDTYEEGKQPDTKVNEEELAIVNLQSLKIANRFNDFKERLLEFGFNRFVRIEQLNRGIVISIPFESIFAENSSTLKPECLKLLEPFANMAGSIGNEIQLVARFTPATGTDASRDWDLARERVFSIGKILCAKYHMHESRLTYGYEVTGADQKPTLQLLVAEKLGVSKVSIKELLNLSKDL